MTPCPIELPNFFKNNKDATKVKTTGRIKSIQYIDTSTKNIQKNPGYYEVNFDNLILDDYQSSTKKISSHFKIWDKETNPARLKIEYSCIKWYFFKTIVGCYYVQLKNSEPIAGFALPKHRWGLKMGTNQKPAMVGNIFNGLSPYTLPQSHCLPHQEAKNIIETILYGSQDKDSSSPLKKIAFNPEQWEDTGLCMGNLTGLEPTDPKWEQAIGYTRNPDHAKWMAKQL